MRKRFLRYMKKFLAMTLVAAMLIQVLPATAKGAELETTTFQEPEAELQTGLSDIYEYETYDAGMAGTVYVNTYTGALHIKRTDLTLGGERMPVEIGFYYDTQSNKNLYAYGAGWSCTYNQLLVYNNDEERYEYKNENGTWIYFVNSGELNEDGEEIWAEDTAYGIRETGTEMYMSAEAEEGDYTAAKVVYAEKTYTFDSNGRLVKISDEYNEIQIAYVDDSEKIDYIVDPVGRTFLFYYSNGFLIGIYATQADGTRIDYTEAVYRISNGVLNGVIYGYQEHNEYIYSGSRVQRVINIDGCGYEFAYTSGKVSAVTQMAAMGLETEESGAVVTLEYPEEGRTILTTAESRQLYSFDDWGRVIGCELQSIPADVSTESTEEVTYTTVYGYNMTYDYVESGGSIINTVVDVEYYDENGVIEEEEETEVVGDTEVSSESEAENDTETVSEDETESELDEEYTTTYDEYGNVTSETHRVGDEKQETKYIYTSDGNYLQATLDTNYTFTQYEYDTQSGLLESFYNGKGYATHYEYNALRELSNAYVKVNGLKTIDTETSSSQLTSDGTQMKVSYEYESGRLSAINYGDSTYLLSYDKWGNLLAVMQDGVTIVSYEYGENAYKGLVQKIVYGVSSRTVYYTYNNLGQVRTVGYAENTPRFEYSYTSDGTLSSIYDTGLQRVTEYTENGYKVYTGTLENVTQLLYEYEGESEKYTEKILEQTVQYCLKAEDELSWLQILDEAGAVVYSEKTVYDAFERLIEKTTTVGSLEVLQQYSYMVNGNVAGDYVKNYGISYMQESNFEGIGFQYTYDKAGNILTSKKIVRSQKTTKVYESTYTYNMAGQLTGAYDEETGIRYAYSYDQLGNIVSKEAYSVAEDGTETLLDQTIMDYDGMVLKNTYNSSLGRTRYGYQTGNYLKNTISSKGTIQYDWGQGRQLTAVNNRISGVIEQYSYNADGLRSRKITYQNGVSATTEYVWGNNGLAGFTNGEDIVVLLYGTDGTAVGFTLNDDVYTYIKNLQGDVLRILDTEGNTVVEYTYDPWGAQTVTGDTELAAMNPCSYRGYDYDEESGLYYLQSRYYNPQTGRFLNADDTAFLGASGTIVGYNLFAYCENNPVNYKDGNGYFSIKVYAVAAVTAAIISAISKIVGNYARGYRGWNLFRGVLGTSIGNAVNVVLLMKLLKWGDKGIVLAALAAAAVQTVIDFAESVLVDKKCSWNQLTYDYVLNTASILVGNYLGARCVYINSTWIQPQKVGSFLLKPYGKRIIAQTGIGAVVSLLIDLVRGGLEYAVK